MTKGVHLATLLLATTAPWACRARPEQAAPAPGPTLKARLHRTIAAHSEPAREVVFSPDSRVLATSGVDGAVKLESAGSDAHANARAPRRDHERRL
ncbi:MAG: WD40 domain-containing protein [Acidobacteriota bacterium]|nr:WD40 domain-containing protein [Acidobacteriota bacterium]MDQ5871781.1 WD40 domain-containing protein [Acidobacteriota bacterium]